MRAEQQGLFDIGRARRAGDEIDRAWRAALAVFFPQSREDAFVVGQDVVATDDDDLIVRQEVERRRIVRADTSATVPVSAMAAKATEMALRSCPSEGPRRISSGVRLHGIAARRSSAPMRRLAGALFSRKNRATSSGTSASVATSARLAAARAAPALNVEARVSASPWPRFGTTPAGALASRISTSKRRGSSAPVTPSERRILATIASRWLT